MCHTNINNDSLFICNKDKLKLDYFGYLSRLLNKGTININFEYEISYLAPELL